MLALFGLRRLEPGLVRPYRAIGYPFVPGLALVIAAVSLVAMATYNVGVALLFLGIVVVAAVSYFAGGRHRLAVDWAHEHPVEPGQAA
jgi:ethanolamine permease